MEQHAQPSSLTLEPNPFEQSFASKAQEHSPSKAEGALGEPADKHDKSPPEDGSNSSREPADGKPGIPGVGSTMTPLPQSAGGSGGAYAGMGVMGVGSPMHWANPALGQLTPSTLAIEGYMQQQMQPPGVLLPRMQGATQPMQSVPGAQAGSQGEADRAHGTKHNGGYMDPLGRPYGVPLESPGVLMRMPVQSGMIPMVPTASISPHPLGSSAPAYQMPQQMAPQMMQMPQQAQQAQQAQQTHNMSQQMSQMPQQAQQAQQMPQQAQQQQPQQQMPQLSQQSQPQPMSQQAQQAQQIPQHMSQMSQGQHMAQMQQMAQPMPQPMQPMTHTPQDAPQQPAAQPDTHNPANSAQSKRGAHNSQSQEEGDEDEGSDDSTARSNAENQGDEEDAAKRRRRKTSASSDAENDPVRRKLFLERNRVAAIRCRKRKKVYMNELKEKVDVYARINDDLQRQTNSMQHDLQQLQQFILSIHDMRSLPPHIYAIISRMAPPIDPGAPVAAVVSTSHPPVHMHEAGMAPPMPQQGMQQGLQQGMQQGLHTPRPLGPIRKQEILDMAYDQSLMGRPANEAPSMPMHAVYPSVKQSTQ